MEIVFDNFDELKNNNESLANELLGKVGSGDWQSNEIIMYRDKSDYARYELTDGWYAGTFSRKDYNGAPDPMDYINLSDMADDLVDSWDNSCHYLASDGSILTTNYGW